jgi:hypothetical protein
MENFKKTFKAEKLKSISWDLLLAENEGLFQIKNTLLLQERTGIDAFNCFESIKLEKIAISQ